MENCGGGSVARPAEYTVQRPIDQLRKKSLLCVCACVYERRPAGQQYIINKCISLYQKEMNAYVLESVFLLLILYYALEENII